MSDTYAPPLDQLLTLGNPGLGPWREYRELGIAPEHVPALIRMVADQAFDSAAEPDLWTPVHAWRALAQLGAAEAAEPLAARLAVPADEEIEDEYLLNDLPFILGMIGRPAIPAAAGLLRRTDVNPSARNTGALALGEIGKEHPDSRAAAVAILVDQLEDVLTEDRELNGFIVSALLNLKAIEAAPAIERAFAGDHVALDIAGDWEDVQVELGLIPERTTPRPNYHALEGRGLDAPDEDDAPRPPPLPTPKQKQKRKAKNKMAKASRRKNRRR